VSEQLPASSSSAPPLSPADLGAALRAIGVERYHHLHPFNLRMHAGGLSRRALQTWVANRYYYQTRIPIKDGLILTKSEKASFRREWVQRIHDHEGAPDAAPQGEGGSDGDKEGGLEQWLRLAEATGLERGSVEALRDVLPGVRRACDAYVDFVNGHDLLESVASSLTELFAGFIMHDRIAAFESHYGWVKPGGLDYFRSRTVKAPRDSEFGQAFVTEHARTRDEQERCLGALRRKCEILWSLLDAVERATSRPVLVSHALLREEADGSQMVVLSERAVRVGGSGSEILSLCDGARSGNDVAETMRARHADVGRVWDDVHDFFEEMAGAGALSFSFEPPESAN
jgi:pyrroloquinoline-quinone synthase